MELACGRGAQALYLAALGYDVLAVDGAINGLEICQQSAQQQGLQLSTLAADIDEYMPSENQFTCISVVRYLNRSIFDGLVNALKPGGVLFYKTFNWRHLEGHPSFNPAYTLSKNELDGAFSKLRKMAGGEHGNTSFFIGVKC